METKSKLNSPVWVVPKSCLVSESAFIGQTDIVIRAETEAQFNTLEYLFKNGLKFNILIVDDSKKDKHENFSLWGWS